MKVVYGDLVLHGADIDTISPGQWLNDQVLEFARGGSDTNKTTASS